MAATRSPEVEWSPAAGPEWDFRVDALSTAPGTGAAFPGAIREQFEGQRTAWVSLKGVTSFV